MKIVRAAYLTFLAVLPACCLFTACESNRQTPTISSTAEKNADEIVTATAQDNNGSTLQMRFDNGLNTVTLFWDGQRIELNGQKAASGIWYRNDRFDLRGKGNSVVLEKDMITVFEGITTGRNREE